MRTRNWWMLGFIVLLTLGSVWVALPGTVLDIGGFKERHPIREGLDLQGGLQVLMEARPADGGSVDKSTLDGTRDTLERRVNGLGVSEPLIQTRGSNQIVVELPGISDPEQAIAVLQQTAQLEIIDPAGYSLSAGMQVQTSLSQQREAQQAAATPSPGASPEATPAPTASPAEGEVGPVLGAVTPTPSVESNANGPVFTTIVSGTDLKDAYATTDQTGAWVVAFELQSGAAEKFYDYTSQHIGQQIGFVLDGTVISAPVLRNAISSQGQIDGMTATEAQNLALQLKAGALGVPLEVVSSQTVGPSLGQDSVDRSLLAGIIGLGAVALFMIIYYRIPGVMAVLALLIYTAITLALYKLIPVTLTLPGIAGFILSIGMAVDANVLIFARLKEELRSGKPLNRAIEAGFDHAWPSIRDSNISTMITCAILYWFGQFTGATIITGFALTLFVGVAVSLFTAITVTRTFLRIMVDSGMIRNQWWLGIGRVEMRAMAGD
ncbi:MAG TPA: protein translocase subunit SecD [Thermomicrobiales bacterium]|nr:protein translocase subunit SecD [Thermomicrobiales bacterium]